jgi:hypothetical protein
VFVEPLLTQTQIGLTQTGGCQYSTRSGAVCVTTIGEAPPATVRLVDPSAATRS